MNRSVRDIPLKYIDKIIFVESVWLAPRKGTVLCQNPKISLLSTRIDGLYVFEIYLKFNIAAELEKPTQVYYEMEY